MRGMVGEADRRGGRGEGWRRALTPPHSPPNRVNSEPTPSGSSGDLSGLPSIPLSSPFLSYPRHTSLPLTDNSLQATPMPFSTDSPLSTPFRLDAYVPPRLCVFCNACTLSSLFKFTFPALLSIHTHCSSPSSASFGSAYTPLPPSTPVFIPITPHFPVPVMLVPPIPIFPHPTSLALSTTPYVATRVLAHLVVTTTITNPETVWSQVRHGLEEEHGLGIA